MKRTTFEADSCPVARSMDAIGDWWSFLILRDAFTGTRRFGEFQSSLGVAKNILASRLKNLVARGMMEIVPASDGTAFKEYALTEQGRGFWPVLIALEQWGKQSFFGRGECGTRIVDRKDRRTIRKIVVQAHDGRELGPEDVVFVKVVAK